MVLAGILFPLAGCEKPWSADDSSGVVQHVAQADFLREVSEHSGPVVVDFYAAWSGPAREFAPVLESAATGFTDKIKFVKVNVDESPGLAQNYKIQTVPALLFFSGGQLKNRISGAISLTNLQKQFADFAAKN